jgi:hypothetical protein
MHGIACLAGVIAGKWYPAAVRPGLRAGAALVFLLNFHPGEQSPLIFN